MYQRQSDLGREAQHVLVTLGAARGGVAQRRMRSRALHTAHMGLQVVMPRCVVYGQRAPPCPQLTPGRVAHTHAARLQASRARLVKPVKPDGLGRIGGLLNVLPTEGSPLAGAAAARAASAWE